MIYYLLLVCSVVLAVVKSALVKRYTDYTPNKNSPIFLFNFIAYGLAAILLLVVTGLPSLSRWTVLPALGYAVSCYLMQMFLMKSMSVGSMGLSSLFCMYGLLIPTVAGPLFFHETFSWLKGVGVVCMLLAIYFSTDIRKEENSSSPKWFIFAILTLLFSGMVGVFEKIYQTAPTQQDINSFLATAFVMIALLNGISLPIVRHREDNPPPIRQGLLIAVLTGLVVVFYNRINLILAGALDTMIYYPISSGGAVLLTLLVSVIVFKEPLKRNHILCFILGTAAILLLGIF